MRVSTTLEYRFSQTPDGRVWTETTFPYEFWGNYLKVFDEVQVIARAHQVDAVGPTFKQVNGPGVQFTMLPCYLGPLQFLMKRSQIKRMLRDALPKEDAVIFRLASPIAGLVIPEFIASKRPYAVEIVADPFDVFAPGANSHFLRPFFRWKISRALAYQCRHASALSAVTETALQERYPPSPSAFRTAFSDVNLTHADFVEGARSFQEQGRKTLIMVGGLSQLYKAPHILIDAVALAVERGTDITLKIVGDGRHRSELEAQAVALGISDRVRFLGQVPAGAAVQAELDSADLFVLPSFQEGLPRAVVEAMARALPCIGSTVGGFPELLEREEMVPPGDAAALAQVIERHICNPRRLEEASARNLRKAKRYRQDEIALRQEEFFRIVRGQAGGSLGEAEKGRAFGTAA